MTQSIIKRLKNLRTIDTEIKSKRQEITSLKSKILKSPQFTDLPKGSKHGNSTENLNLKIIDDTRKINQEIEELYKERQDLVKAINQLDDNLERNIIRLHYLNNYTWQEISCELNWSIRQLQRIKSSAICNLEKIVAK